jgi:hypothetical protein
MHGSYKLYIECQKLVYGNRSISDILTYMTFHHFLCNLRI